MYDTSTWQKAKTVKRYLHPPRSERLFTFWPEGKIMMGENEFPRDIETEPLKDTLPTWGVWPVHTRRARIFDYKAARQRVREDGVPIHGLTATFGGFEMDMEAFCDTARRSTCFVKITVTNKAPYRAVERFGLLVRSGKERKLIYGAPDGYCTHAPEVSAFQMTPNTFYKSGNILRDGMTFVGFRSDVPLNWDAADGCLWVKHPLNAGESYEIYLCFGKGEHAPLDFDYEAEKQKTIAFWQKELSALRLPEKLTAPDKLPMVKNLVAQLLQCYAYYVGKDFLVPRQGALQRFVWIWDQLYVLEAISRMGLADYYRGAISTYFDVMQKPDGEVVTVGENWASDTSCALQSLAVCCLNANDRDLWETYAKKGFAAFTWIKNKRRETVGAEGCVEGLFPPMRGSDWGQIFQNWNTDIRNLIALEFFLKAAETFGGVDTEAIRAEYGDYLRLMQKTFADATRPQKDSPALHIPIMPLGDDKKMIEEEFYPYLGHGGFLYAGVMSDADFDRVLRAMEQEGISSGNGLYGHMPYPDGNTHIWYTTAPEIWIFRAFRRRADFAAADAILGAILRYCLTDEYVLAERYADNDPWFVPWMPNASGSGRLLSMLLDTYAD